MTPTFDSTAVEAIAQKMGWYVDNTGTIRRGNGDTPKSILGNVVTEENFAGVITVDGEPVPVTDDFNEVVYVAKRTRASVADPDVKRKPSREFGHCRKGYAVEFNIDGECACRTLTMETRQEAEVFKASLEQREFASKVEVVRDA